MSISNYSLNIFEDYERPDVRCMTLYDSSVSDAVAGITAFIYRDSDTPPRANEIERLHQACIIAAYGARHLDIFSQQTQFQLADLGDRLFTCLKGKRGQMLESLAQALHRLHGEIERMKDAPDPCLIEREWEVVASEPTCIHQVEYQELQGLFSFQQDLMEGSLSNLEVRREEFARDETPSPRSPLSPLPPSLDPRPASAPPRCSLGEDDVVADAASPFVSRTLKIDDQFLNNELTNVLYATLDKILGDEPPGATRNPLLGAGKQVLHLFLKHLLLQWGSSGWLRSQSHSEVIGTRESQLVCQVSNLVAAFIRDYLLGLGAWQKDRLARSMERLVLSGSDWLSARFVVPCLLARPREFLPPMQANLVSFLQRTNTFLQDYTAAYRGAEKQHGHFHGLHAEAQEALIVEHLNRALNGRGKAALFGKNAASGAPELGQRTLLRPHVEQWLKSVDLSGFPLFKGFLEDFPDVPVEFFRVLVEWFLTPSLLARSLDQILRLDLCSPERDEEEGDEMMVEASTEVCKSLGKEVVGLGQNLLELGDPNLLLSGAMLVGEGIAGCHQEVIGSKILEGFTRLLSDSMVQTMLQTSDQILWKSQEGGKKPVFTGIFELKPLEADALRRKGEEYLKDRLVDWLQESGVAEHYPGAQMLVGSDGFRDLVNRASHRCYGLLWQPTVLKMWVYHYLLP